MIRLLDPTHGLSWTKSQLNRLVPEKTLWVLLAFSIIGMGFWLIRRIFILRTAAKAKRIKTLNAEQAATQTPWTDVRRHAASMRNLLGKFRERESRFLTVFDHSLIGTALISLKGRILKVNRRLCDLVGYREMELLSMSFDDLAHPDDATRSSEMVQSAAGNKNEEYRDEKRYVCKNGAVVWVSINVSAVLGKKGGPIYFISQFEDITERKNADRRLKEAYSQIADQVKSIREIAWKQSHLVRSPLANLKGLVDLLTDNPADQETLGYIQKEVARLDAAIIQMAEDACEKSVRQIVVKKRTFKRPVSDSHARPAA